MSGCSGLKDLFTIQKDIFELARSTIECSLSANKRHADKERKKRRRRRRRRKRRNSCLCWSFAAAWWF